MAAPSNCGSNVVVTVVVLLGDALAVLVKAHEARTRRKGEKWAEEQTTRCLMLLTTHAHAHTSHTYIRRFVHTRDADRPPRPPSRAHSAGRPELETAGWGGGGAVNTGSGRASGGGDLLGQSPGWGCTPAWCRAPSVGGNLQAFRAAPPGCQARLLHWIKGS